MYVENFSVGYQLTLILSHLNRDHLKILDQY